VRCACSRDSDAGRNAVARGSVLRGGRFQCTLFFFSWGRTAGASCNKFCKAGGLRMRSTRALRSA
jgi:hypothetical protein